MYFNELRRKKNLEHLVAKTNRDNPTYKQAIKSIYINVEDEEFLSPEILDLMFYNDCLKYNEKDNFLYFNDLPTKNELLIKTVKKNISELKNKNSEYMHLDELDGRNLKKYLTDLSKAGIVSKNNRSSYRILDSEFIEKWPYNQKETEEFTPEQVDKYLAVLGVKRWLLDKYRKNDNTDYRIEKAHSVFDRSGVHFFDSVDMGLLVFGDQPIKFKRSRLYNMLKDKIENVENLNAIRSYQIKKGKTMYKKNKFRWDNVEQSNHDVANCFKLPTKRNPLTNYFVGLYMGDGGLQDDNITSLSGKPKDCSYYLRDIRLILSNLFNVTNPYLEQRKINKKSYFRYKLNSKLLNSWIKNYVEHKYSDFDTKYVVAGAIDSFSRKRRKQLIFSSSDLKKLKHLERMVLKYFATTNISELQSKNQKSYALACSKPLEKFKELTFLNPKNSKLKQELGFEQENKKEKTLVDFL